MISHGRSYSFPDDINDACYSTVLQDFRNCFYIVPIVWYKNIKDNAQVVIH